MNIIYVLYRETNWPSNQITPKWILAGKTHTCAHAGINSITVPLLLKKAFSLNLFRRNNEVVWVTKGFGFILWVRC